MRTTVFVIILSILPSWILAEEPYLEQLYQQGARACKAGDNQGAINAWYKYLELYKRLESAENLRQRNEVESRYRQTKEEMPAHQSAFDEDEGTPLLPHNPADSLPLRSPKVEKRKQTRIPRTHKTTNLQMPKLLARAEKEKAVGHFEDSRRLYQLAVQLDPGSKEAKTSLDELNQLMGGN